MTFFSRLPLYSLAATLCMAVVATILVVLYGSARVAEVRREGLARAETRLNQSALRAEELLSVMVQLSRVEIELVAPLRDRHAVEQSVRRLLDATDRKFIYGVGIAYAPQQFPAGKREFGVYATTTPAGASLEILDGSDQNLYENRAWFIWAHRAAGQSVFLAPYSSRGIVYIGMVQAFYRDGRFAGVVVIDAERQRLQSLLRQSMRTGDRMEAVGPGGRLLWDVGTARVLNGEVLEAPLGIAPWSLRLIAPTPEVTQARKQIAFYETLVIATVWVVALLICAVLIRTHTYRLRSQGLEEHSAALQLEILSRVAAEEQLRVVAYRDHLTGLPNRPHIVNRVNEMLSEAEANPQTQFALFLIDLDRFAVVNDSLGHVTGDAILSMVAQRLGERLPPGSGFGRLGGDEFIVCCWIEDGISAAGEIANHLLNEINRSLFVGEREIMLTGSIGVVLSDRNYQAGESMLRDADIAMYAAKHEGPSRFAMFDQRMRDKAVARLSLESRLRKAIRCGEFVPHYQPIIDVATGEVHSVEALARWVATDADVDTGEVILVAEQSGLISGIDRSMLEQVCTDVGRLEHLFPKMQVAVNISATYLAQDDFVTKMVALLKKTSTAASRLKLEVTETAIMNQPEAALRTLQRLRALGSQIVIDDFGTGHSSLSYAQRLPIAGLKIDRSFVTPIANSMQSAAIVRAIVALARTLGLHVTAEGVETREQFELLREMGVDYVQGWYFSKALPFGALVDYITVHNAAGNLGNQLPA